VGKNLLKGVNMLQFVVDTLIICHTEIQNILTIKCILRFFELASRLKVNFHKSKVEELE